MKLTIYNVEPGKAEVVKDVVRKTEARDSQGRRYSSAASNLPPQFRYDMIRDYVAGRSYQVNRQQKLAYFTTLDSPASRPDLSTPGMQEVEVNGIRCLQADSRLVKPDGGIEVTGTSCRAADLG
jgi:hypothetical protein